MYRDKELKPLEGEERRKKVYKKKTNANQYTQSTNQYSTFTHTNDYVNDAQWGKHTQSITQIAKVLHMQSNPTLRCMSQFQIQVHSLLICFQSLESHLVYPHSHREK